MTFIEANHYLYLFVYVSPYQQTIPLATLVDNVSVQPDTGDLWLGANVNGYKFMFDEGRGKGTAQVRYVWHRGLEWPGGLVLVEEEKMKGRRKKVEICGWEQTSMAMNSCLMKTEAKGRLR